MQEVNRNTKQSIGTTAEVVSLQQEEPNERVVIFITNTSTGGEIINISIDEEAKAGEGIQLQAGGYYQESKETGFKPTQRQISAICDGAGGEISIHERIIIGGR